MTTASTDPLALEHLLDPEVLDDPYPFYRRLREADPVHRDAVDGWVLTRHADVVAALREPRMSAERANLTTDWLPESLQATLAPAVRAFMRQILFLDPPDHTRLRGLVSRAFTPRAVEAMRARIQAAVNEMLDPLEGAAQADIIRDLAFPLPVRVIADMLGIPMADQGQFTQWTFDLGALIGGGDLPFERMVSALQGVTALMDYFRQAMAEHRAHPRDDLLQALIAAEDRGDVLDEDELLGNCMLLLAAGHGTTTHLIGNGMLALLRHPEQMRRLRDDPSLAVSAVVEFLRYDGPVQMTSRLANADLELGGRRIATGENVVMLLGAANRDPEQFPDPDRLDLTRAENRHVAFGHGIHYCLGAPLAYLEGQIAIPTLLRRFPALRLASDPPVRGPGTVFRGLHALPVALR
ncbi:MAG TPA: cytochrome P450 [Ktedonobacterales bacterium]|nr:cytochrome P450 [Ktedonobacterales bacterium]